MDETARTSPNILVTGTRGTCKTTTCSLLADATNLQHINVGGVAQELELHHGWDDYLDSFIIDETKVCLELEDFMEAGGIILDHHDCHFFPEEWFDCVVVLQTDRSILKDRLSCRGYMGLKLTGIMEDEIAQVPLEVTVAKFEEDIVMALRSDSVEDISRNVAKLTEWVDNWRPQGST